MQIAAGRARPGFRQMINIRGIFEWIAFQKNSRLPTQALGRSFAVCRAISRRSPKRGISLPVQRNRFSRADEAGLKQESALMASIKQRGAIMMAYIISLVYRGLCRQSLNAMRRNTAGA